MSRARQILEGANGRSARLLVAVALVAGVSLTVPIDARGMALLAGGHRGRNPRG
jgi:hypothetical protein